MTLSVCQVDLHFKAAIVAFPPERIVGLFGGQPPVGSGLVSGSALASITDAQGLDIRGSLTEVRQARHRAAPRRTAPHRTAPVERW